MNKDQCEKFLIEALTRQLGDAKTVCIVNAIAKCVLENFDETGNDWEQLSVVKSEIDRIWIGIKKCSEREIVKARVNEAMKHLGKLQRKIKIDMSKDRKQK